MADTARAAVFFGPGKPFEIRPVPIPEIEPEAALIRVTHANICGSDLHFWRGDAPLRLPDDGWIFGHEMTGRVARLGSKVKTDSLGRPLKEGDRVAYTYFYPCGRCYACLHKEPAACPSKIERPLGPGAFPHLHGAFADHYYLRPRGEVFVVFQSTSAFLGVEEVAKPERFVPIFAIKQRDGARNHIVGPPHDPVRLDDRIEAKGGVFLVQCVIVTT